LGQRVLRVTLLSVLLGAAVVLSFVWWNARAADGGRPGVWATFKEWIAPAKPLEMKADTKGVNLHEREKPPPLVPPKQ
jgi:hypothetical protein